jgi:flavin reductase ActVB
MDDQDFTTAMARVAGPVTVVTTVDGAGRRWGFTSSSFGSVSLDPPLVLACLAARASTHAAFTAARHFLVNVLAQDQEDIARRFARSGTDRFAAGDMMACELGLPGLAAPCARIACALQAVLPAGDHSILLGRVLATRVCGGGQPLVYCDRSYASPAPLPAGALATALLAGSAW